jgi:hypothetical protein
LRAVRHAFIIILAFALASCEPSANDIPVPKGAEYFPLKTGAYAIYDVDSIHVYQNVESQYLFQLRIEVKDSFANGAGSTSFVIMRQRRGSPSEAWTPAGTGSAWTDDRSAVTVEDNQRFVKLQFPINVGNEWDGNQLNNEQGDDDCGGEACDRYEVTEVDPDVVVVQSDVEDTVVKYDVRKEVYGKDIGLIYKEMTVLEYCTSQNCLGNQFVDQGVKYRQTLIEHGQL